MTYCNDIPVDPADIKTWYELLKITCEADGENIDDLVFSLNKSELQIPFNAGYAGTMGVDLNKWTAWGNAWVYFPLAYDMKVWVGHAPRNPSEIAMPIQDRPNWSGSM